MSLIYQAPPVPGQQRPGLYLGDKTDAKNREKLRQRHVTHIVNMTPAKEAGIQAGVPNYFESSGAFTYLRIPVLDAPTSATDLLAYADDIVRYIVSGLHHGSVLVHCQRGISRSATAILFYLMRRVGMTLDDGLALIQRRRPTAEPIPAFMDMLKEYEASCRKLGVIRSSSSSATDSTTVLATKDDKAVDTSSSSTKKRRPIGPAMPPTKSSNGVDLLAKKKPRAAIGPAIEPSNAHPPVGPTIGPSIGPAPPPPSATTIGPQVPPSASLETTNLSASPSGAEAPTGSAIGPQLPPSLQEISDLLGSGTVSTEDAENSKCS